MSDLIKLLKRNSGMKLLALSMSIVACLSVHVLTTPTKDKTISHRVFTLPVTFANADPDLISTADVKEVVVTLRGTMALLNRISPELLSAEVDLSTRNQPGNAVESIQVRTPSGATVTSVNPSYTWVKVSKRLLKHVPVRVSLQGQVKSGCSVGTPSIYPSFGRISGAEANVERVSELRAPIAVTNLSSTLSASVASLVPIDDQGETVEDINVETPQVNVTVPVHALANVSVSCENIRVKAAPGVKYTISVEPKSVLLDGGNNITPAPTSVKTQSHIIIVKQEEVAVDVPLIIPDGFSLAPGTASSVNVKVVPQRQVNKPAAEQKAK